MQIGSVKLSNQVISAPMAGVTDKAYRILAREQGCGLIYTEMISAQALDYHSQRTWKLLDLKGEEPPLAVQIFGSKPEIMARAAFLAQQAGASIIDINMGCPTPKIVKNGEGSALMKNSELAFEITEAVVRAVKVPVTVKIRKGWDEENVNAVEIARGLAVAGAAAVAIHGRTRSQFYSGQADWDIIGQVAGEVNIPVIGNGDIRSPQDAWKMLKETGCAAVMIGRGSMGNPWIFGRTAAFLQEKKLLPEPTLREKIDLALKHLKLVVKDKGEHIGVREMRKHLAWYIKGAGNAARIRDKVFQAETVAEVVVIFNDYLRELES